MKTYTVYDSSLSGLEWHSIVSTQKSCQKQSVLCVNKRSIRYCLCVGTCTTAMCIKYSVHIALGVLKDKLHPDVIGYGDSRERVSF